MNYFSSTLLPTLTPGSVGPIKYYWSTQDSTAGSGTPNGINHSPFYATAATTTYNFLTQDSGILIQDWARWRNVYDDYNQNKTIYDALKDDYNRLNAESVTRNANWWSSLFTAPKDVPKNRPCKPDHDTFLFYGPTWYKKTGGNTCSSSTTSGSA